MSEDQIKESGDEPRDNRLGSEALLALVEDMEASAEHIWKQVERMSKNPSLEKLADRFAERAGTEQFWASEIRKKFLS